MNKKLFLIVLLVICLFFISCSNVDNLEGKIRDEIEKANYCNEGADCKIESFGCPFDCYNLVNNDADIAGIDKLVEKYYQVQPKERECVYECMKNPEVIICENNKCVAKEPLPRVSECITDRDCVKGGCSGTICQSKDSEPIFSTCEFLPEYSCYKQINCGCVNGKCGWDRTPGFDRCVKEARVSGGDVIV
jgi:eight-cysteine-cluster-containing protein|tara:strand:- start:270 stop:842 length:573 start_codon:yes stop_codon:yes gene_type:complete